MTALRRLLGTDLVVYAVSTAVLQGTTILLAPVLTRTLGPAAYGEFELLQVAIGFLFVVLVLGVDTAVVKVAFDDAAPDHATRVISAGFAVVTLSSVLGGATMFAAAEWLSDRLTGGSTAAVRAAAVALPLLVVMTYTRQTLRIDGLSTRYLVTSAIGAVTQVGVVLVLVLRDQSVTAVFVGLSAGALASAAFSIGAASRRYRLPIGPADAGRLVRFGAPIMLTGVAGWAVMFVDRVILTRYVTLDQIGFYGLANKVALVLNLVIYSFGAWWPPHILRLVADDPPAGRALRASMLHRFLCGVALVGVPVGALAPELVRLVAGDDYLPAAGVVPILVVAFLLLSTLPVTQIAMLVTDRSSALVPPAVAAGTVNIVGCVVLCPHFGIAGAAWSTVAAFGVQAVGYYVVAQRLDRVHFPLRNLVALAAFAAPFLVLGRWQPSLAVGILVKGLAASGFAAVMVQQLRKASTT